MDLAEGQVAVAEIARVDFGLCPKAVKLLTAWCGAILKLLNVLCL